MAIWKKLLPLDKKTEKVDNVILRNNVTDSTDKFERVPSKSPEKNLQKSYPDVNFFKIIPISSIIGKLKFLVQNFTTR